jgi:hypothetical protein
MSEILQSPFTIGVCLVALLAWIMTLVAIFWPSRDGRKAGRNKDDIDGYL